MSYEERDEDGIIIKFLIRQSQRLLHCWVECWLLSVKEEKEEIFFLSGLIYSQSLPQATLETNTAKTTKSLEISMNLHSEDKSTYLTSIRVICLSSRTSQIDPKSQEVLFAPK